MAPVTVTHFQPKPSSQNAACQIPLGCGARQFTTDPTQVTCRKCHKRSKRVQAATPLHEPSKEDT